MDVMEIDELEKGGKNTPDFNVAFELDKQNVAWSAVQELTALVTVRAPQYVSLERESRAPVDVIAVVDRSGSMAGQKLNLMCQTLEFMVQQLKDTDGFSIVSYDTNVRTDLGLGKMDASRKALAADKIHKLQAGDMTNLSGGLLEGLMEIKNRKDTGTVASVLLFTDGRANQGITDVPTLVNTLRSTMEKVQGAVSIFTFGFGADHDPRMLREISECGHGMYYFIETADKIPESFGDCLGGLMSVVAHNIRLTVTGLSGVTINRVQTTFDHEWNPNSAVIRLGDLYSEESRDFLFTIHLPAVSGVMERMEILKYQLDLFSISSSELQTVDGVCTVKRGEMTEDLAPSISIDRQRNRFITTEAIKKANELADKGDLDSARAVLTNATNTVEQSAAGGDGISLSLKKDMQECVQDMSSRAQYKNIGAKKMHWFQAQHSQQRAAVSSPSYQTSEKRKMMAKFKPSYAPQAIVTPSVLTSVLGGKLLIGNECHPAEATQTMIIPLSSEPQFVWKVFVRGDKVEDLVESVQFQIHPTFQPNKITVSAPPFEIERTGWGIFVVGITVVFKNGRRVPLEYNHQLELSGNGKWNEVPI